MKNKKEYKYIFLDVDGVLNNKKHYKKLHKKYGGKFFAESMPFNPRSLKNLRKIVKKTNAKIIISSSWRRDPECMIVLKARLTEYGLKIHDTTKFINGSRGLEITEWLNRRHNSYKYIIIDDNTYDSMDVSHFGKLVLTNCNNGLDWIATRKAIKLLGKEKK